jgi:RNA polymerase sigma-B factor
MMQNADRDRVILEHRYLCRRAARRFVRPGLERSDLEQVAAIGLIKAADRYDDSYSTPFEAYAWVLMLGELMHYVRDGERLLRAPRRVRDLERRWVAAERELSALLGREPRDADVAGYINATPADRREIEQYRASERLLSYESLVPGDHQRAGRPFDDLLERMALDGALAKLGSLEREIVTGLHLEGLTVVELAKRLGYSRRHLTRLHRSALTRLKNFC